MRKSTHLSPVFDCSHHSHMNIYGLSVPHEDLHPQKSRLFLLGRINCMRIIHINIKHSTAFFAALGGQG